MVPSDKTRGHGHRLKHLKLPLNVRKYFSAVMVVKHWDRLPREVVESPSLEIFKTQLDKVLSNQLLLTLLELGVGLDDLSRSRPTSVI